MDVLVQCRVYFFYAIVRVGEVTQNTNGLVTVFKAVTPRTPKDTFAERLSEARNVRKVIRHANAEDNLACCVGSTICNGGTENIRGSPLKPRDFSINKGRCVVKGDLLPSLLSKLRGSDV